MTGSILVHGLVHVPLSEASDVALCGDVGDQVPEQLDVTCTVCVAYLTRRQRVQMGPTTYTDLTTEDV